MTTGGLNNQNELDMKKLALAGSALLVVAALSCTRELDIETPVSQEYVFEAVWADGSGTRTALQEDGTSVWWTTGDEINVFYGSIASGKFVSTNTEPVALTSFSGSLPVVTGTVEGVAGTDDGMDIRYYTAGDERDDPEKTLAMLSAAGNTENGTYMDSTYMTYLITPEAIHPEAKELLSADPEQGKEFYQWVGSLVFLRDESFRELCRANGQDPADYFDPEHP